MTLYLVGQLLLGLGEGRKRYESRWPSSEVGLAHPGPGPLAVVSTARAAVVAGVAAETVVWSREGSSLPCVVRGAGVVAEGPHRTYFKYFCLYAPRPGAGRPRAPAMHGHAVPFCARAPAPKRAGSAGF